MSHPSFAEYVDALRRDLATALSDPLLARGCLLTRGPGLPVAYSGNFALTFVVDVDGRWYALRCFHKWAEGLQERYAAIGRHLRSIASPYFVDFEFQPSGITTESGSHPMVRMEWAEGRTLGAFVAEHRRDAGVLLELRDTLRRLAANLGVCGIAHGDIQPSNIVVAAPGRVKLIDYDGMFVPALRSWASAELGQRNFQHPGRREYHFDERLDAFSFAVLDLTLDALAKRPELWDATGSGEDAFVLRAEDFLDPAHSPTFRALVQLPRLEQRVRNLAAVCASPYERVPSFSDFLAGRNIPEVSIVFSGDPSLPLRRRYASPHPVVDAASFAQCCSHVGDRVELVGCVVRVARSHTPRFDASYLRVEFGERGHDMACLKIWPDAQARLGDLPDPSWAGQWVSAVGLLEPVARGHSGAQRQRDVSVSITDRSQLQRISETEARYRLQGRGGDTRRTAGALAGVRTDPVVTDAAPRPPAVATRRPHGGTRPARPRTRPATAPAPAAEAPAIAPLAAEAGPAAPNPPAARVEPAATRQVAPSATGHPRSEPVRRTPSPPRPSAVPAPRQRRAGRFVGIAIAAVAAAGLVIALFMRAPHEIEGDTGARGPTAVREPAPAPASAPSPPPEPAAVPPPAPRPEVLRVQTQQPLRGVRLPLATVAGALDIDASDDGGGPRAVRLDGKRVAGLSADLITLVHRVQFSDREVIVGFTHCAGAAPACALRTPFLLVLRATRPPEVHPVAGVWANPVAGSVTASADGVRVELGLWNGERRAARLTPDDRVETSRQRATIRRLPAADCAIVTQSLESCARAADCSSFASSARPIPRRTRAQLARIYHQTTGLDAAAYRSLCQRSCELGLTPSRDFVRRYACSGAQPGQWAETGPTAGLFTEPG